MAKPRLNIHLGDYMRETQQFTTEQHGAYFLLLAECWTCGGRLPNDPARLARIARLTPYKWKKIGDEIQKLFEVTAEFWTHIGIKKSLDFSADKSEKAAASAEKRWQKSRSPADGGDANASANAAPETMQSDMRTHLHSDMHALALRKKAAAAEGIPTAARDPAPAAAARDWNAVVAEVVEAGGLPPTAIIQAEGSIVEWARAGFVPELDILPVVKAKAAKPGYRAPNTVGWFTPAIREHHERRTLAPPPVAAAPAVASPADDWGLILDTWEKSGRKAWAPIQWGNPPIDRKGRYDRNCRVPRDLLIARGIIQADRDAAPA